MQPSKEQIDEWTESPVTRYLVERLKEEEERYQEAHIAAFTPFDAQRTQEIMAGLNGALDFIAVIIDTLEEGSGLFHDEPDGDLPEWEQDLS